MDYYDLKGFQSKAKELRRKVLDLGLEQGEAHIGGCFSEIEILITLYDLIMEKDDKFILSKGHCSHPMYLLLREKGLFPKITSHPDMDEKNGIFCTTGSLGHGLPIATGMAWARKIQNKKGHIYVLMGDGESQEGSVWETIPLTVKHKLDNLTIIIDRNKVQALDHVDDVSPMDLKSIFSAFGCHVIEIDGHNFSELFNAFKEEFHGRPKVIIANTIKGKGVSFMENDPKWHARLPDKDELTPAYEELK